MFILYPGQQQPLEWYSKNPSAFLPRPVTPFQPFPLPFLTNATVPQISAHAYAIYDLDSFTPIISQNATKSMMPASTVKLATSLVSYTHYKLDDVVTVKSTIEEETKMDLTVGERISVLNLLYGALMYSANDAAYTLAEHYTGGIPAFVEEMNTLAQRLHMNQTHFTNPIGFDDPQQTTTARDLALLAREFIYHPFLLNITSTKYITVTDADYTRYHYLSNLNELVGEIPHLGGLKTGTTELAGQNLISYYTKNGKQLAIVILKSEDRFADTRLLIDLVNTNLTYSSIE